MRVSLTPRPGGDRREEVYAACELLQSLGLRAFAPSVTACPGCGRTTSTTFQELAESIQGYIRDKMPEWKRYYEGVEELKLAVMGCIVNGPGESKAANIGISLPGTGESPRCPVYIDGQKFTTLEGNYDELSRAFQALVNDYISNKYPRRETPLPRHRSSRTGRCAANQPVASPRHRLSHYSGCHREVSAAGERRSSQSDEGSLYDFASLHCFLYLPGLRKSTRLKP